MSFEEKRDKFQEEDLPRILAALQNARTAKAAGSVRVEFGDNGGVIAIMQEIKRKYK